MKHYAPFLITAIFCLFAQTSSAQWQSLKGPYNAYVNNVRQNSAYIFLTSPDGLYRSNNAGQWWEKPAETLQENDKLVLLDANDDQLLAISRKTVFSHTFSTLHVSTDNGDIWSVIELPDDAPDYIKGGAISDDHIVLISDFKILESTDGGQSWFDSPLAADLTYPSSIESYDHRIYVTGDQKLAVYDEGSANFIWIPLPSNIYPTRVYAVDQGLFVYTSSTKTLFRSEDEGQNWQTSTPTPIYFAQSEMVLLHDTLFMMNGSTLAFSKDQGLSWTTLYGGVCCAPSGSFIAVSQDNLVICSTTNGTKRSKSIQGPWFDANNGLHAAQVPDLETDGSYLYAISSDRGLFRYDLLNAAWDTLNLQSFRNPEYLDACVHNGNLYAANATYPSPAGFSVGQSIDYGSHWNNVTPGWQNPMEEDTRYLYVLEQSTGAILVYGTKIPGVDYGIHLSRDGGAHWTEIGPKFAAATSNSHINSLALQGDTVWASSPSGLFFCTDDASTWVLASNGLSNSPNVLFNEFAKIYAFDNLLFAVNNYGLLFRSIDQGGIGNRHGAAWATLQPVVFTRHLFTGLCAMGSN